MNWRREDHKARIVAQHPAVRFDVIDITPRHARTPEPEQAVAAVRSGSLRTGLAVLINRRVTKMELEAHQARRTVAVDAARERMALEAANEALEPLARTWWARLSRALRGLMGGR